MREFQTSSEVTGGVTDVNSDISTMSAAALRQALARGQLTAAGVTQAFLDRIEAVNPVLGAVIAVSPDAVEQAAASARAWPAGRPRPREGIPVLV